VSAEVFRDRLVARLAPGSLSLTSDQIERLAEYWRLLERWNSRINLTSLPLRDYPSGSLDRLIVEPLLASPLMPATPANWYDLGSGGGSPAIPLKIATPGAQLIMVESRSRKAAFLREAVRSLALTKSARVEARRFEDLAAEHVGGADCITSRAVRADGPFVAVLTRLASPGAQVILFESVGSTNEIPGFKLINSISLPATSSVARLIVPRGTKG
jgi:16S rRNA (guanine527-N7)-methyltransferase